MFLLLFIVQVLSQNCLNEKGEAVDWWVIFKYPTGDGYDGREYRYCDSKTKCEKMLYHTNIDDQNSALQRTVVQIDLSQSKSDSFNIIWNDQPTRGHNNVDGEFDKGDGAHSKGVLHATKVQGFIINHSTPGFPMYTKNGQDVVSGIPYSAQKFAQHYFCATYSTETINQIAAQLLITDVWVFKSNEKVLKEFPYLSLLSMNTFLNSITTLGGMKVESFAIRPNYRVDFYSKLIAPKLDTGLAIETWIATKEKKMIKAKCKGSVYKQKGSPYNTDEKELQTTVGNYMVKFEKYEFSYTKDHSKYAVSLDEKKPFVCFSDINREETQFKRGGTAFCISHDKLWTQVNAQLVERQECFEEDKKEVKAKPEPMVSESDTEKKSDEVTKIKDEEESEEIDESENEDEEEEEEEEDDHKMEIDGFIELKSQQNLRKQ